MGNIYVTIKLMPESLKIILESIKIKSEEIILRYQGRVIDSKEEPVAFGLNALIIKFSINESQELEPLEEALQKQEGVNSVSILEMNRAL